MQKQTEIIWAKNKLPCNCLEMLRLLLHMSNQTNNAKNREADSWLIRKAINIFMEDEENIVLQIQKVLYVLLLFFDW